MLDLYKLHIFTVVVEQGSFSAAAERLHITQSAVSQHIKDLEAGLGRQLFQRGWRGVQLTAHGEILDGYARQIFALVAQTEAALIDVAALQTGKLSFGATPGIAVYLVPGWMQQFRQRYPRLTVAVQTGVTAQVVADVLGRRLDFGLIEGELEGTQPPRLAWITLAEIEQWVIVGVGHDWWTRSHLRLEELHRQSFVMRSPNSQTRIWLDAVLKQQRVEPDIAAEFDNPESMKRVLATASSLTILPEYAVRDEVQQGLLRAIPLEGSPLRRTLKLIYNGDAPPSPVARAFLEVLRGDYPALAGL